MKKIIITLTILLSIGLITTLASACYRDGYQGCSMMGTWGAYDYSAGTNQKFLNDTVDLRTELAAKKAEFSALMAQSNPNPKQAAQISKKITSLHDQLRTKMSDHNRPQQMSSNVCYDDWGLW